MSHYIIVHNKNHSIFHYYNMKPSWQKHTIALVHASWVPRRAFFERRVRACLYGPGLALSQLISTFTWGKSPRAGWLSLIRHACVRVCILIWKPARAGAFIWEKCEYHPGLVWLYKRFTKAWMRSHLRSSSFYEEVRSHLAEIEPARAHINRPLIFYLFL